MTNELEKQFFQCFGIEPKEYKGCDSFPCSNLGTECENCKDYKLYKTEYPQITDRILLELICINEDEQPNIEWLKQCVLENLIHRFEKNIFCDKEQAVKQVRTLFEEG